MPIAVTTDDPCLRPAATALAARFGLSVLNVNPSDALPDYLLWLTAQRLELRLPGPDTAIAVDFSSGRHRHRRQFGGGRQQLIAHAVGLNSRRRARTPQKAPLTIVDATAGFGHDAFVLASLGCHVTMLERSSPLAALLADGLRRAAADPELCDWLPQRLHLISKDARDWLRDASATDRPDPDVVYLDPMYPHNDKAALAKKEPRALRALAGDDSDAELLLDIALTRAARRVVVKRPKSAAPLAGPRVDFACRAGATRYDVYLLPTPRSDQSLPGAKDKR